MSFPVYHCLSIYLSVCDCLYLLLPLSVFLRSSIFTVSVCLSACLSVYISLCLPLCLSAAPNRGLQFPRDGFAPSDARGPNDRSGSIRRSVLLSVCLFVIFCSSSVPALKTVRL